MRRKWRLGVGEQVVFEWRVGRDSGIGVNGGRSGLGRERTGEKKGVWKSSCKRLVSG